MSGLVRGKIECYIYTANRLTLTQAIFKALFDFFTTHPQFTLIASQFGNTSGPATTGAGTGSGFYDSPASFGYHAFFVVRQNATTTRPFDVYHMWQWSGSVNQGGGTFGSSPGNPGLVNGQTSPVDGNHTFIAHAAAIGVGGTGGSSLSPSNGNPWKGTSNANGADTKATSGPVWGAPPGGGTGVMIWPRSNSNIGSHRTLAQNMGGTIWSINFDTFPARMHIVADDDSFVIAMDAGDFDDYTMSYSGLYTPRNNLSVTYPYCVIDSYNALPWSNTFASVYGDLVGTSAQQGGIVTPVSATVAGLQMDHYNNFSQNADFWPDKAFSSPTYNQLEIPIGIYETSQPNYSGFLGQLDFVREMYNVPTNAVSADFSRIFIGLATLQQIHYAIPWDKTTKTVPRSGASRNGITFVTTSLDPNK